MKRSTQSPENGKKDTSMRTSDSKKKTIIIPSATNLSKMPKGEPAAMVKLPLPEVESIRQYAFPMKETEGGSSSDTSRDEIRQIQKKLTEHVKKLEDIYSHRSGEKAEESLPTESPLYCFLSTCESATDELDSAIDEEHEILESLQMCYGKEVDLLQQLALTELTTPDDAPASPDAIAEEIEKMTQNFHKLRAIKSQLQNSPKTLFKDPMQVSSIGTGKTTMRGYFPMPCQITNVADYSAEELRRIIHEFGIVTDLQVKEYQKLESENIETEKKFSVMKAEYQHLLEEKLIIEDELRHIFKTKRRKNTKAGFKPDEVMLGSPAVTADGLQQVLPAQVPGIITKQADELKESGQKLRRTKTRRSKKKKKTAQGNGTIVDMITPEVKSAQEKSLIDTSAVTAADTMTSHIKQLSLNVGIKPTDSSHAKKIMQEKAKNLTDGSVLIADVRGQEQVKATSDMHVTEHENGHKDYRAQLNRVTRTSDPNDQQAGTGIAIHTSLDVQSGRRESIRKKQEQTRLIDEAAKKEEGQGTLRKTQESSCVPGIIVNESQ